MHNDDVATQAVRAIRASLRVDPEWSTDTPDGFAWWGHDVRQEITARPEVGATGDPRARIVIRTEVATDVTASGAELAHLVAAANVLPLGGAARATKDGRLVIESTFPFAEETLERVAPAATTAATMALTVGRDAVEGRLADLGGSIATSAHPESGTRHVPDEMLDLPSQFPVIASRLEDQGGSNPWSQQDEWDYTARFVTGIHAGLSTPGATSLTAQFPLRKPDGDISPLALLNGDVPTSLLHAAWLDETNIGPGEPLGPGLMLRLFLPSMSYVGFDTLEQVAYYLNEAEIERGGAPDEVWPAHFGAWTLQPSMNRDLLVAYTMWVPAMLASRLTLADVVLQQAFRTTNATRWLAARRAN